MNYIDTHAHVFSHTNNFIATARYIPSYTVTAEDYLAQLDNHGFAKGVLIQPSFLGTNNEYMLAAIAKYPDRLKGVAVLDNDTPFERMQELAKQGIVGIRLNLFGMVCPDLTQNSWQNFFNNLEKLNWQIDLHASPSYLIQLLPQLSQYQLPVVVDHFGRIDPEKGIEDSDYQTFLQLLNPNQHWVKVSGYYRLVKDNRIDVAKSAFQRLLDKKMTDNLVWGSDWPHTQHESAMSFTTAFESFQKIVDDKNLANKILTENSARLLEFTT